MGCSVDGGGGYGGQAEAVSESLEGISNVFGVGGGRAGDDGRSSNGAGDDLGEGGGSRGDGTEEDGQEDGSGTVGVFAAWGVDGVLGLDGRRPGQ